MKRLGLVLLTVAAMLTLGGCPDEKKPDPAPGPTGPTMTDAEALIGTYASGQHVITFTDSNTFTWNMPRPCAAPPCPVKRSEGTYSLRHGKIYFIGTPDAFRQRAADGDLVIADFIEGRSRENGISPVTAASNPSDAAVDQG